MAKKRDRSHWTDVLSRFVCLSPLHYGLHYACAWLLYIYIYVLFVCLGSLWHLHIYIYILTHFYMNIVTYNVHMYIQYLSLYLHRRHLQTRSASAFLGATNITGAPCKLYHTRLKGFGTPEVKQMSQYVVAVNKQTAKPKVYHILIICDRPWLSVYLLRRHTATFIWLQESILSQMITTVICYPYLSMFFRLPRLLIAQYHPSYRHSYQVLPQWHPVYLCFFLRHLRRTFQD